MKSILLVGSGPWGQNYINTIKPIDNIELKIANRNNWTYLIDKKPDGVIVCTPPDTHIKIADYSLSCGIPTMIEKPLALSYTECEKLKKYNTKIPILVNHIHLFSQGYQDIKREFDIDDVESIYSIGKGPGLHKGYSNLWDYGPHDIAYMMDLIGVNPNHINATKYIDNNIKITLNFEKCISNIEIGNSDLKARELTIKRYNKSALQYNDIIRPKEHMAPLTNAINVFLASIDNKSVDYRLGLDLSLKVINILEACQASIDEKENLINI